MKQKPSRLENIALIKTVMMIVIVLYHSFLFFGGSWFTAVEPAQSVDYLYHIAKWMNTFHIQTFAMASGFLFYYLGVRKRNSHVHNILKRAKRLLVPYFFTCIFWVIPIACYFFHFSIGEVFYEFVLMAGPSQLWFLVMLFMVFCFFEFFGRKLKFRVRDLVTVFIITVVLGRILSYFNVEMFQIAKSVQYVLYFYLGGFIYYHRDKISMKQTIIMAISAAVFYAGICLMEMMNNNVAYYAVFVIKPIVSILEVSSIYYVFTRFVDKGIAKTTGKFYRLLEANSFGIYLFHQQIIYFTIVWFNGVVHPIIQAALSFVIATCISLAMSIVLKKWRVTRVMFGL